VERTARVVAIFQDAEEALDKGHGVKHFSLRQPFIIILFDCRGCFLPQLRRGTRRGATAISILVVPGAMLNLRFPSTLPGYKFPHYARYSLPPISLYTPLKPRPLYPVSLSLSLFPHSVSRLLFS
jgi:hypothetical protein